MQNNCRDEFEYICEKGYFEILEFLDIKRYINRFSCQVYLENLNMSLVDVYV